MSERIRESLSALMDGEANELEIERVLKNSEEHSVRNTWLRYHRVREVLHSDTGEFSHVDVSAQVMAAIASESQSTAAPVSAWHKLVRPAASFAVAASVFAAVLVGSQFYGLVGPATGDGPALAARVSTVGMVNTQGGAAVRASYAAPATRAAAGSRNLYDKLAQQRLQRYMLSHTEEVSLNAPQGMMPYARVASFEVED
jgi:sigma-E factor negative regulatory protein RseA